MGIQSLQSIIPEGELRCVWMDAGVIEFKLCNRAFECETCEFNSTLKQQQMNHNSLPIEISPSHIKHNDTQKRTPVVDDVFTTTVKKCLAPLYTRKLAHDRTYHKNHFWIRENGDEKYQFGIDHVAAYFFHPVLSIVFPKIPSVIQRHDPFCWIILTSGAVTLRSPINGTILRFNDALKHQPTLLNTDSYSDGWMMEISSKRMARSNNFNTAVETQKRLERQLHNIELSMIQTFHHYTPNVGPTHFDGGIGLESFETMLGPKLFLDLVNRIMNSSL